MEDHGGFSLGWHAAVPSPSRTQGRYQRCTARNAITLRPCRSLEVKRVARGLHGHRGMERTRENVEVIRDPLVQVVLGCAIDVHRQLGMGLLESAYRQCLAYELTAHDLSFKSEVTMPITYRETRIDCGFRVDMLVEDRLVLELKSIERLLPVHTAQVLAYLRLSRRPQALLINFNVPRLKDGVRSFLGQAGHERKESS